MDIRPSSCRSLFDARPLRVELLTNRVGAADRLRIRAALAAGEVDIAIGTHAVAEFFELADTILL